MINYAGLSAVMDWVFLAVGACYIALKRPYKFTSLDKVILLFLLSILMSIVFSLDPPYSFGILKVYLALMMVYYIAKTAGDKERRQLIRVLLLSAVGVCVCSLFGMISVARFLSDFFGKNPSYPYAAELMIKRRAHYPFMTPGLLAGFIIMVFLFSLGVLIEARHRNKKKKGLLRSLSLLVLSISFPVLLLTLSISGLLVFILSLGVFLVVGRLINKKALAAMLLLLVLAGAVFFVRMQGDNDFIKPTFSMQKRLVYWKETAGIVKTYPLTGIGPKNLVLRDTLSTHNSYLQILAEMGPLALISWLGIVLVFIRNGLTTIRSGRKIDYYRLGIFTAGLTFILQNTIDFSFFFPEVAFFWWLMLGLSCLESKQTLV